MNSNAYGKVPTAVWVVGYVVVGGVIYWLLTRKSDAYSAPAASSSAPSVPSATPSSTPASSSSVYGHPASTFMVN